MLDFLANTKLGSEVVRVAQLDRVAHISKEVSDHFVA